MNHLKADINVAPLVDVTLVLLIVFLLSSPTLHPVLVSSQGAKQPHANAALPSSSLLSIRLFSDTRISFQKKQLKIQQLGEALKQKLIHRPPAERDVVIEADETLQLGQVLKIMAIAQESGAKNILLSGFDDNSTRRSKI